jgi:hypothetical protein
MSDPTKLTVWRVVEAAAALLVLGFFLFSLRGVLNPSLLFFLVWAVLAPFRGKPGHSELMVTASVLDPLVDVLEGARIRRLRLVRPLPSSC